MRITLCFISRVTHFQKSSYSSYLKQSNIVAPQIKAMANTIFLSLAFLDWHHHIGAMAQFWRQPKYPKCVPDCYKNLHFRPLLISMHKGSINWIEGYTRNAFLVFEWRLLIVICADLALLWRNSIWQKNCISQYISLVPLYWKLVIPFKWTWFFKCLWHELWNIVYYLRNIVKTSFLCIDIPKWSDNLSCEKSNWKKR